MKIGICVPTRGMVFSEVVEAIENERQQNREHEIRLYISNNLPIPDGHNGLCSRALADGCDYILFIEEDVVIPAGSFEKMLATNADIACIDYGVAGWSCIAKDSSGEALWCGLGATLIHRRVFEEVGEPYFRADMVLDLPEFKWRQLPPEYVETRNYGSLDIWFFSKAREAGFRIIQVEGEAKHLQLVQLGRKESNHGLHEIQPKPSISKYQLIERG